jgi:hypothetical protein
VRFVRESQKQFAGVEFKTDAPVNAVEYAA